MQTTRMALIATLIATGCGGTTGGTVDTLDAGLDALDAGLVATTRKVNVRLIGLPSSEKLELSVARVDALVGGHTIPVATETGTLDLSLNQAYVIGTFTVPEGVQDVSFRVYFAPQGTVQNATGTRSVSLIGAPITFESPAELLLSRQKVVIQLDVDRSLVADTPSMDLLPAFTLAY